IYWRRPGKESGGWSATTGKCRNEQNGDLLYVFSSNAAPLESERAYSKFSAYAILHHHGDHRMAAQAIRERGYSRGSAPKYSFIHTAASASAATGVSPPAEELPFRVIPASQLRKADTQTSWLWHGYLTRNGITLLSALWKAGKTTLLCHLLKAFK